MRPHASFLAATAALLHVLFHGTFLCTSVAAQGLRADRGRETSSASPSKRNLLLNAALGVLMGSDLDDVEGALGGGGGGGGADPLEADDPLSALEGPAAGMPNNLEAPLLGELLGGGGGGVDTAAALGTDFFTDNFVDQTPVPYKTYQLGGLKSAETVNPNAELLYRAPRTTELGGEVFNVYVGGYKTGTMPTYQKIAENGFANPVNKYMWTQAIDEQGNICIGTFNVNYNRNVDDAYYDKVDEATAQGNILATLDSYSRLWSGSPITYTDGGETYCRSSYDVKWTMVHKLPKQHTGFRGMTRYKGMFFAGSANGPDGPGPDDPYDVYAIYKAEGGPRIWSGTHVPGSWKRLESGAHLNGYDRSIRAMCTSSYTNKLYAGTETLTSLVTAARLISYDANAPAGDQQWATYRPVNFGLAAITECLEIAEGFLFVGATGIPAFKMYTLDEKNGYVFEDITGNLVDVFSANYQSKGGSAATPVNVILELRIFKGRLYMGILDGLGAQLFRTPLFGPGTLPSWELVTVDGFAKEQEQQRTDRTRVANNPYTWCGAIIDDVYYIGTLGSTNPSCESPCRSDGRGQLFASTDGINWKLLVADAFGENWTIGLRTMVADPVKKMLSIGTASVFVLPVTNLPPYTDSSDSTTSDSTVVDTPQSTTNNDLTNDDPNIIYGQSSGLLNSNDPTIIANQDMGSMALQPDSIISLSYVMDRLGVPHP